MHDLSDVTRLPDDFDGRVRLFPLPGLVLFPHAMQPLHIFEPRYCEMLLESLKGDRLIAMATLHGPGSGTPASDAPPTADIGIAGGGTGPAIDPIICIGKIISHAELEDDRHNILLVGAQRARVRHELDAGRPFRIGEVEVLPDIYSPAGAQRRRKLKQKLLEAFAAIVPATTGAKKSLHELMAGQMGLGPITDIIAYTLPFEIDDKLRLLAESDVDDRARDLVELLRSGQIELSSVSVEEQSLGTFESEEEAPREPKFPPPFSLN